MCSLQDLRRRTRDTHAIQARQASCGLKFNHMRTALRNRGAGNWQPPSHLPLSRTLRARIKAGYNFLGPSSAQAVASKTYTHHPHHPHCDSESGRGNITQHIHSPQAPNLTHHPRARQPLYAARSGHCYTRVSNPPELCRPGALTLTPHCLMPQVESYNHGHAVGRECVKTAQSLYPACSPGLGRFASRRAWPSRGKIARGDTDAVELSTACRITLG